MQELQQWTTDVFTAHIYQKFWQKLRRVLKIDSIIGGRQLDWKIYLKFSIIMIVTSKSGLNEKYILIILSINMWK